ncbi:YqaE/Pmp3 family membrane protein [uncultured Lutibacter sp.]|uniref:YqaE/Pmp3 family membrane protein n=1 Tax=uncultured Lutibacter sp. TaxID=437739 RepID=UPI00262CD7EE|nr:YqaE/Pmp3 family membrane protein [uncultured Lutibacter sp.]
MGCFRVFLCIIFPPLAVIDKGCGSIIIVFILTCLGWIPGVIAALIINNNPEN